MWAILVLVVDAGSCSLIALRQRTGAMTPGLVPCVEEEGDLVVHRQAKEVPPSPSPWGTMNPKHLAKTWTKKDQRTGRRTWHPSAVGTSSQTLAAGTWRRVQDVAFALVAFDGVVFGMRTWKSTLTPC